MKQDQEYRQLVAVVVAVFDRDRVLALRRASSKDAGAGLWETVSGRVRPAEDPFDAAVREVAEETGLQTRVDPRPVDAYAAQRGTVPMIVLAYRATWCAGHVQCSGEHDAHAWWSIERLEEGGMPARLAEAVRRAARRE